MSGAIERLDKITSSRKSRGFDRQIVSTPKPNALGSLNERLTIDKGATVAITVKTKGHKTGQMVKAPSTSTPDPDNTERSKRSSILTETKSNWPGTFREQTKVALRQSRQFKEAMCGSKSARVSSGDYREPRRPKSDPLVVNPSAVSVASRTSSESVIVTDKGVQCGGLFDSSRNHFNLLNPIRTIAFLMKELESLVKDDKSSTILSQMEQALSRVPSDFGKSTPSNHEAILKHTQLEASVAKLAATGREMQNTVETMQAEKAIILQQLEAKSLHLESSLRRESELESVIKDLRQKLSDTSKLELTTKKLLTEKTEKIQLLQNITSELKSELNEQTELAQQRFLECQFLKMEKEKLSVISSFKDSQLVEHRKAIKNLQNLIGDQLLNIQSASRQGEDTLLPTGNLSIVGGGRASSSPINSMNNSGITTNHGHDVVDISEPSVSTIDVRSPPKLISKHQESQLENAMDESEFMKDKFREKAHLEFTSIGGDEASILQASEDEFIYVVPECGRGVLAGRTSGESDGRAKRSRGSSGEGGADGSGRLREEIHIMYENTRINSQVKVRVPSPPRNYQEPNWSDSSLPTMSISESNVV